MIASWQMMLVLRMPMAFKFSAVLGPKAPDGHPCSPPELGRISSFGKLCVAANIIQSAVEVMASSVTSVLKTVQRRCAVFCPGTQHNAHRPLRKAQLARRLVAARGSPDLRSLLIKSCIPPGSVYTKKVVTPRSAIIFLSLNIVTCGQKNRFRIGPYHQEREKQPRTQTLNADRKITRFQSVQF